MKKGFDNINYLQFDKKNKRLNAMILTTGDNNYDNKLSDSIIVSDSNKWMFLNVKNDVGVFSNGNDLSHSDAVCNAVGLPPSEAGEKSSDYFDKGRLSIVYNGYDTLTEL